MSNKPDASIELVIAGLNEWFSVQFDNLGKLTADLQDQLCLNDAGILEISNSVRRKLKAVAEAYLADNEVVDGCGLIFGHAALGTRNGHLEWWVREDEARFARYSFGVVPGADRYYDYEQHDWFIRAYNEGIPAMQGPFIDYLGVEAYVVTITMPAIVDGLRVGAVGNDIQVSDLEALLLPILLKSDKPAVLVNRHGSVIFSNVPEFLSGEHIESLPAGFAWAEIPGSAHEVRLMHS